MSWGHNTLRELVHLIDRVEQEVQGSHDQALHHNVASHASLYSEVVTLLDVAKQAVATARDTVKEAEQDAEDNSSLATFLPDYVTALFRRGPFVGKGS